jgi:hypothetical protein
MRVSGITSMIESGHACSESQQAKTSRANAVMRGDVIDDRNNEYFDR